MKLQVIIVMLMPRKKKNWKLIYKGSIEEFDNSHSSYWEKQSATSKFREVRSLCDQYLIMKGLKYSDVSRLLRSTAVLKRQ
jgi:hypothetical protein